MVNPIKPYVIDTGLAVSYSLMVEPDIGHLLENCVFMELCRQHTRVTYLKTASGYEVDFVAEGQDGTIEAIQVSADNHRSNNPRVPVWGATRGRVYHA